MPRRRFVLPFTARPFTALPFTALAASVLLLTACAPVPETAPGTAVASEDPAYCARMVTNSGGLEDRSFNQSSWEGLERAAEEYGIDVDALVSANETDLAPNVHQAVETGCPFVLTVGWELADATAAEAKANPAVHFAIVDEQVEGENIKPIVFDTAQASYLAGYLAAGVSKTGTVATFGGGNQPPVTLFMDGFVDGVAKYNELHESDVEVLGWDKETQNGLFTGNFDDTTLGKTTTEGLLDQGADVIMPVAGQVGEGAAAAILERGDSSLIWVDNDGFESLPENFRPVVLTSVLKNTQDAVVDLIGADMAGEFDNDPFIGTLENGGVEIAPFHDKAALVPAVLAEEIEQLRAAIIAGIIDVTSPSAPE